MSIPVLSPIVDVSNTPYLTEYYINNAYLPKSFVGDPLNAIGWRDLVSPLDPRSGTSAPTWAVFRNGLYLYAFPSNAIREVFSNFHLQHDYYVGSPIFPHIHFTVNTTNSGVVRWGIEYTIAKGHQQAMGSIFEASTIVYVEQTVNGATDRYKHFIIEVANGISHANLEVDCIVMCRIFRDATHVNDTYPDSAFAIQSDLHYQVNRYATLNRSPNFYTTI